MRLLTWNLAFNNKDQSKTIEKAISFQPDLILLQECEQEQFQFLEQSGYKISMAATDMRNVKNSSMSNWLIIASKLPILKSDVISYNKHNGLTPWTRLNSKTAGFITTHQSVYVDVESEGSSYRVFNVHLTFDCGPSVRVKELLEVMDHFAPDRKNVIMGDFNTFGAPTRSRYLSWLFSYEPEDGPIDERKNFAQILQERGYKNCFNDLNTWPTSSYFRFHLDDAVVPVDTKIVKTYQLPDRTGSDHTMLLLEI